MHGALSKLLQVNAVPDSDVLIEYIEPTTSPWPSLLDKGYVELVTLEDSCLEPGAEDTRGMRLTKAGMDNLIIGSLHRVPRPCFAI